MKCGPGHGISIGGVGEEGTKACVSDITVRDVIMQNTLTGVRIKTWQVKQLIITLIQCCMCKNHQRVKNYQNRTILVNLFRDLHTILSAQLEPVFLLFLTGREAQALCNE